LIKFNGSGLILNADDVYCTVLYRTVLNIQFTLGSVQVHVTHVTISTGTFVL